MSETYYSPEWMTPKTVAWTPRERELTEGMPYPVAKGYIDAYRVDYPPSYHDLFGGNLGSIFGFGGKI